MSRPRLPIETHIARGSYRADRHGPIPSNLRRADAPSPQPPEGLDEFEDLAFRSMAKTLYESRLGRQCFRRPSDEDLVLFAVLWNEWICAEDFEPLRTYTRRLLDRLTEDKWNLTEDELERFEELKRTGYDDAWNAWDRRRREEAEELLQTPEGTDPAENPTD